VSVGLVTVKVAVECSHWSFANTLEYVVSVLYARTTQPPTFVKVENE